MFVTELLEHRRGGGYALEAGGASALQKYLRDTEESRFEEVLADVILFACFIARHSPDTAREILAVASRASIRLIALGREPVGLRPDRARFVAPVCATGGMTVAHITPPRPIRP